MSNDECPKCRSRESDKCHSMYCPMRSQIIVRPEELERRQRIFTDWACHFHGQLMELHRRGFRGWIIKDGKAEELMDPICQQEIDMIHEYITDKAKALGLL